MIKEGRLSNKMFERFLEKVDYKKKSVSNVEEFFAELNGKTFLKGMYRLFRKDQIGKWTAIVEEAFPNYKGTIEVFGFDWMGQIFATRKDTNTVLWFQPGTGEVLDIPSDFVIFHDTEIVEYPEDALVSKYFDYWFENNEHYTLKHSECVGYKVPLYLNGEDDLNNLEVSDMEVYWGVMSPLIKL